MDRRKFLGLLNTSAVGGLISGCVASTPVASDETGPTSSDEGSGDLRGAEYGVPPNICEQPIRPDSGIYAITDPAFATDWQDRDIGIEYRHHPDAPRLAANQTVIGVTWANRARAYPITVLLQHEVVNDTAGQPIVVTYCPICRSGMVALRVLRDEPTTFAVSGQLWIPERVYATTSEESGRTFGASYTGGEEVDIRPGANLVLYDAATRSYWSQILAHAICGPLAGKDLSIRPSTVANWADWREAHPETEVLLPPPHSTTIELGTVLG